MRIIIDTIPQEHQRYDTVGDWWLDPFGNLQIRVTEMKDKRHAQLIAVHELVEALLCMNDGITTEQVDAFDKAHTDSLEPGDNPASPYRRQHNFATAVERMMCAAMNLDWFAYDNAAST